MKKKVYLYPMRSDELLRKHNPYVYNLSHSLLRKYDVVNYGKNIEGGILDILKYFFQADIFYFNWIENISKPKAIIFSVFTLITKLFNKKVVWTHHNVHSHYHKNDTKNPYLVDFLSKNATNVILHTKESYPLLNKSIEDSKMIYFFHPFFKQVVSSENRSGNKKYDLLIWGNVRESKGVPEFLQFLREKQYLNKYKILIIGKFESLEFFDKVKASFGSENIEIKNEYISSEDLDNLHRQSKYVFFPYTGSSVLNSGALVTSLPKLTPIIGPNKGAFKELGELELIKTYKTFEDVINILEQEANISTQKRDKIKQFCEEHTWELFSDYISKKL